MTDQELSQQNRANIATARESVRRAMSGYEDVGLGRVIGMLDAVLASTCPHDPALYIRTEVDGGREVWFARCGTCRRPPQNCQNFHSRCCAMGCNVWGVTCH